MYMIRKSLVIMCGLMVFTLFIIGNAFADVHQSVEAANGAIQSVASPSFRGMGLKEAYVQDIEGINETFVIAEAETETADKNELYQDALDTVNELIVKTDGCVAGNPDDDNWIINCTDATSVLAALNQLAADITALIQ